MAPGKLTRKEIVQKDVIRRTLTETSHWAVVHFRSLAIGAGAILVAVLAVVFWQHYSTSRTEALQSEFADALALYHAPVGSEPSDPDQASPIPEKYRFETKEEKYQRASEAFSNLAVEHSGSRIGNLSRYYLALSQHELGSSEEARRSLTQLIGESAQEEIKNLARHSLAQLLLSDGRTDEAVAQLEAILAEPSANFPTQLVLVQLAETAEKAGDYKRALEHYRRIGSEFPGSSSASDAANKIRRLEARVGPSMAEEEPVGEPPAAPDQSGPEQDPGGEES